MINRDYSISFVRLVATVFIIVCHIYQYFCVGLTFWFNVAVQMFFFISGYLYGNRKIDDVISFYGKNFKKILVPYYLCVIIIGGMGLIFKGDTCNLHDIGKLLILDAANNYMPLHNLWFIAYILLCYLMTPFVNKFLDRIEEKKSYIMLLEVVLFTLGVYIFFEHYATFYKSLWIICYLVGIFYRRLSENYGKVQKYIFAVIVGLGAIFTKGVDIYLLKNPFILTTDEMIGKSLKFHDFGHVLLGTFLCIFLSQVFRWIFKNGEKTPRWIVTFLDLSDKYSYEIYLVHQVFILGAFSLYSVISSVWIATIGVIVGTIVAAIILHKLSEVVFKIIK